MRHEITMLWAYARAAAHLTSRKITRDERGIGTLELVIIVGALAALAIAAVAIIRSKVLDTAESIPTS